MKNNLVADSGYNKEQLSNIVETSVTTSVNTKKRDWRKMFRYRMASHAIAQLTKRDFVSLHRDSESAQNHLPSWRKKSP